MSIHEVNASTGEVIDREPTAEELEQRILDAAETAAKEAAEQEKLAIKEAVLTKLGLTEDELKAVIG